uniref:Uncharacterized protein n=1 Tax=Graphocephala atropunctata TaxID=36148 RepID=A0A1B6MI12_9HEMI
MVCYLLTLVWCCSMVSLVYSNTLKKVRNEINELHENAKVLEEEHQKLAVVLENAKRQCEEGLRPLREKQAEFEGYQREATSVARDLAGNITLKHQEEQYLIKALHRELLIHNKYSLKIELSSQELELLESRRREGLGEGCRSLRHSFPQHESTLAVRSMGIKQQYFDKDAVVVLQNELNSAKIVIQALETKIDMLVSEIQNFGKLCEAQKNDLLRLINSTETELKEILINVELFQEELEKYTKTVEKLTVQLHDLKESNKWLKSESSRLNDALKSFSDELECYTEMSNLAINYQ